MEKRFETLRKEYPVFTYNSYNWEKQGDDLLLTYDFSIGESIRFTPSIRFMNHPAYSRFYRKNGMKCLENFVFHIGMIELISYWKCCCPPEIRIACAHLDEPALKCWKKLYYHGLGEFFYLNHIRTSMEDFVQIRCDSDRRIPMERFELQDSHIVPVGGGKDSVVTLETLKSESTPPLPMIINPRGATIGCVAASGLSEGFLEIRRTIDPKLLELNAEGYLNGHTPFSAMLAFHSMLAAALSGRSRIALSNESSANEPTVQDSDVNHQYSKSLEFESDFRDYVRQYLSDQISYYSFLRPLSELQIAKLFAGQPAYFRVFRSCNVGSKSDIWCGHCAKCLFAFIILSPFIAPEELAAIFGKNLFEDETLLPTLKELCGVTEVKPFECVGTREEVCMALCESMKRYMKLPELLEWFSNSPLYRQYREKDFNDLTRAWDSNHFLPETEALLLKRRLGIQTIL